MYKINYDGCLGYISSSSLDVGGPMLKEGLESSLSNFSSL